MTTRSKVVLLFITIGVIVAAVLGTVGYQSFRTGFSAKAEPHMLEVMIARKLRYLAIPLEQREKANPVSASPEVLGKARAHFADHCATCHANDGTGKTPIGQNVYPKAPDLRLQDTQSMSDGESFSSYTMRCDSPACRRLEKESRRRISIGGSRPTLSGIFRI